MNLSPDPLIKEEFENLQHRHQESGKTLKEFLLESGIGYSTYSYWRKKFLAMMSTQGNT